MVKYLPAMQEMWVPSPEEGNGYTPLFLLGESHGQRILTGYSPWGHEESDTTFTFSKVFPPYSGTQGFPPL